MLMMMIIVMTMTTSTSSSDRLTLPSRGPQPSLKIKQGGKCFLFFVLFTLQVSPNLKTCYCPQSVPRSTLRPISRQETAEVGPGGDHPCQGMLIFKRAKNIDKLPNKLLAQKISKMVGTTRVKTSTHATFDNHRLTGRIL